MLGARSGGLIPGIRCVKPPISGGTRQTDLVGTRPTIFERATSKVGVPIGGVRAPIPFTRPVTTTGPPGVVRVAPTMHCVVGFGGVLQSVVGLAVCTWSGRPEISYVTIVLVLATAVVFGTGFRLVISARVDFCRRRSVFFLVNLGGRVDRRSVVRGGVRTT